MHCEDAIDDYRSDYPDCVKWFIFVKRLRPDLRNLAERIAGNPKLFADYQGKRVRITMASRLGDLGITEDLESTNYQDRVTIDKLTNFSDGKDAAV